MLLMRLGKNKALICAHCNWKQNTVLNFSYIQPFFSFRILTQTLNSLSYSTYELSRISMELFKLAKQ